MRKDLDTRVRARARQRCEYCHLPQACYLLRFQIDHIIADQHGGPAISANLCLACPRCNTKKGPNIAGAAAVAAVLFASSIHEPMPGLTTSAGMGLWCAGSLLSVVPLMDEGRFELP
jgi:HNH endonuclease